VRCKTACPSGTGDHNPGLSTIGNYCSKQVKEGFLPPEIKYKLQFRLKRPTESAVKKTVRTKLMEKFSLYSVFEWRFTRFFNYSIP
jgi:hypothetical protein